MKKPVLLVFLGALLLSGGAWAQIQKGTVYLGGTVRFNGKTRHSELQYPPNDVLQYNTLDLTPEIQWGKFLGEHTMAGIGLRYRLTMTKESSEQTQINLTGSNQLFSLLPFVRHYKPLGQKWAVFVHGEIGPQYLLMRTKERGDFPSLQKGERWQYGLSVKPGVVYSPSNKKWAFEAYANILSLDAEYIPFRQEGGSLFTLKTGLTTDFPSYLTLRIVRYFSSQN